VIVNCTGLGSKALFNDEELIPVKGQLTVMGAADRGYLQRVGAAARHAAPGAGNVHPQAEAAVAAARA
jgi:hypothetical protein